MAGWRQLGTGPTAALLYWWWTPVWGGTRWPSVFSAVLHASFSLSASSPRAPSTCPQSRMRPCGVCSTPATEWRGEHAVPRALARATMGPISGGEGGNGTVHKPTQDWSEHKSQNTIFHVNHEKNMVGRDFKLSPSLSTKGEPNPPVTGHPARL